MAPKKFSPAGRIDFAVEGFRLTWGPEGLIVEAIDYDSSPLGLSWEFLRELVDAGAEESVDRQPS